MSPIFANTLDRHFGIHAPALQFRSERSRVLASNLANADTPGFQARDVDFASVLGAHQNRTGGEGTPSVPAVRMAATDARHIAVGARDTASGPLLYRNPYQPTLDGNTVEAEVEQANFAENAVQYQASLMFLTGKIRGLRNAITGGQ